MNSRKNINLVLLMLLVLVIGTTSVAAVHDANIDITPDVANCGELGNTFTLTVENDGDSEHGILEVRIYEAVAGLSDFECGTAPTGWTLFDFTDAFGYCEYKAQTESDRIEPDESVDFTFNAVMSSDACVSSFKISTLDDHEPVGEHEFNFPAVRIDCSDPVITKTVGEPRILIDDACNPDVATCDFWINYDTVIDVIGEDNQEADECNLGLEYCRWRYTLDEESPEEWNYYYGPEDAFWDIQFDEDSNHYIEIECVDLAGNEASLEETDKVDGTAPETEHDFLYEHYEEGRTQWIDTVSRITLTAEDPDPTGYQCAIGEVKTYYQNHYLPEEADWTYCYDSCGQWETSSHNDEGWELYQPGTEMEGGPESCHVLEYYSVDKIGNKENVQHTCFFVDKTPPVTEKRIAEEEPQYGNCPPGADNINDECFITSETEIQLLCEDRGEHPSGNEVIWWRYQYTEDGIDWSAWLPGELCDGEEYGEDGWCDAGIPFCGDDEKCDWTRKIVQFPESSLHKFEWYCEDAVGKGADNIDREYFRVDNDAPEIQKSIVGPHTGEDCDEEGEVPENGDMSATCYLKGGETELHVAANDVASIHASGLNYCYYEVWWEGEIVSSDEFYDPTVITFNEDSEHIVKIYCYDNVGNEMVDVERFLVDMTPPETIKHYGEPSIVDPVCAEEMCEEGDEQCLHDYCTWWITSDTNVSLEAEDEKSGVYDIYWRNLWFPENDEICHVSTYNEPDFDYPTVNTVIEGSRYCHPEYYSQYMTEEVEWESYMETGPFKKPESSCHVIEYKAVDMLGNEEMLNWQCVFVDNEAPIGIKEVGQPSFEAPEEDIDFYVTDATPIFLRCEDDSPHPVGMEQVWWRFSWWPTGFDGEVTYSDWMNNGDNAATVYFPEDSWHDLEFKCVDGLNNENEVDTEYFIVETVEPETNLTFGGEHYVNGEIQYIDTNSWVELHARDPEPHPSGVDVTKYRYYITDDEVCYNPEEYCEPGEADVAWETYNGQNFVIPEESCHVIEYYSVDRLENTEDTKAECVFVDKQPPVIEKEYIGPYLYDEEVGAEWISSETIIDLDVYDDEPHPSGLRSVDYRISLVADENCWDQETYCQETVGDGEWQTWDPEAEIRVPEQSCHQIEVVAVDNVGKTNTHKQCVFVDNTAPIPVKTVGEPFSKIMSEEDYTWVYYPEVNGHCWADPELDPDSIDCWKVTLLTPIELACEDQQPHPVGVSNVCFKADWDGSDVTERYCEDYNGNMNQNGDGFCCTSEEDVREFYFGETTEHNLAYYCEDVLGNRDMELIDDEKFKVEETAFEIELNKKWNLISVPVRLLDNSMDEIFGPHEDVVLSVWQFDGYDWKVYTPNGDDGDDTLTTMEPGWGYWVLTDDEATLTIGGSLLSPAQTPPSVPIVHGWNLIGYYGADGQESYEGPLSYYSPVGSTNPAWCTLATVRTSLWDTNTPSLSTWWEPYNTDGNSDTSPYVELDAWYDWMDAGAGYWLFFSEPEGAIYARSTTCGNIQGPGPYNLV